MPPPTQKASPKPDVRQPKTDRLAKALKENLKRRKQAGKTARPAS